MNGFVDIVSGFSQAAIDALVAKADDIYTSVAWVEDNTQTLSTLATAVANVTEPTKFIISNETYNGATINLQNNDFPVWVIAENSMGVIVQTQIWAYGNDVKLEGILFQGTGGVTNASAIYVRGNNFTLHRCRLDNVDYQDWVQIESASTAVPSDYTGRDATISYCEFINKTNNTTIDAGVVVVIKHYSTSEAPLNHHVHHCLFKDIAVGLDSNGFESINTFSTIDPTTDTANDGNTGMIHTTTIEDNLFLRANGEIEIISGKNRGLTTTRNTFEDCLGGLTLRGGSNQTVTDSYFVGCEYAVRDSVVDSILTGNVITDATDFGIELYDNGLNYDGALNYTTDNNYVSVATGAGECIRMGRDLGELYNRAYGSMQNNTADSPDGVEILNFTGVDYDVAESTFADNDYYGAALGEVCGGWTLLGSPPTAPDMSGMLTEADVGIDA